MAQVFANDPASAFAMSANLDQQRVQNFLNSLAQNRNTQLQGWEAARSMASARQQQEQQQQNQALQVAQIVAGAKQNQQRNALQSMLANQDWQDRTRDYALRLRDQEFREKQPTAAEIKAEETQRQEAATKERLAAMSENVAKYLNERAALLAAQPAQKDIKGAGFLNRLPFVTRSRADANAEAGRDIASVTPFQSGVDFSTAKTPDEYRQAVQDRIAKLTQVIPTREEDLNQLVRMEGGRYVPLFQSNPLVTPAVPPPPAPSAPVATVTPPAPGLVEPMVVDRFNPTMSFAERLRLAQRDPSRVSELFAGNTMRETAPQVPQPTLPHFRDLKSAVASGVPAGGRIMLWDAKRGLYRPWQME